MPLVPTSGTGTFLSLAVYCTQSYLSNMLPYTFNILLFLSTASCAVATASGNVTQPTLVEFVFHYYPNIGVAATAGGVFLAISVPLLYVLFRAKTWWGLVLPIGAVCESTGFLLRIIMTKHPNSVALIINSQIFIVCSPAAFLAFNYILFGRFVQYVGRQHSHISPEILSTVFMTSDITTFFIQCSGSSLLSRNSLANIGQKIWLSGLVLQAFSYLIFFFLLSQTHLSINKDDEVTGHEDWRKVLYALHVSSVFISIRCIYRVAEVASGNVLASPGTLMSHEIYFYLLDTIPLVIAISVYIPYWPDRFIKSDGANRSPSNGGVSGTSHSSAPTSAYHTFLDPTLVTCISLRVDA